MNPTQTPSHPLVYIGVDVCALWLDIHGLNPRSKRLANSAQGHAKIIAELPEQAHVMLEATGGYEHALWLALLRAGKAVTRLNPARVRQFTKGLGILAKTDKIDAAMLQRYGEQAQPKSDVLPSEWELRLKVLSDRRVQLVTARAAQLVQEQQLSDAQMKKQARALIKVFDKQVSQLDKEINEVLSADEARARVSRLQEMTGVGKVVSATLLSELPELGKVEDARISSLVGLAPHPHDSGPMKGQRHIQGGRHKVRRVLYMASLQCVRRNPILKTFYQQLLKRGKPFKVAITAVMRKLICVLNKLAADPTFQLAK
jgi:transposase